MIRQILRQLSALLIAYVVFELTDIHITVTVSVQLQRERMKVTRQPIDKHRKKRREKNE